MSRRAATLLLAIAALLAELTAVPPSTTATARGDTIAPDHTAASPGDVKAAEQHARMADHAGIYRRPDAWSRPARIAGGGFLMVTVKGPLAGSAADGGSWYRLRGGGYVQAGSLRIVEPSSFHGVEVHGDPPRPFGWLLQPVSAAPAPGAASAPEAPELPRYTRCEVYERARDPAGEPWVRIDADRWVRAAVLRQVQPAQRPRGIGPADRWVEIDLAEQTLVAYAGDRMVYATLVASGIDRFPTRPGLFTVWWRRRLGDMSGFSGTPDFYRVEDVPYAMFFDRGTALHGAYWHDRFGSQVSHGCVNIAPADARWIWDWSAAPPGRRLRVWIHASPDDAARSAR